MNNNLLALIGAVGFIHRPVTKESEKQIEELEKLLESEYGIKAADIPDIPDKESILPAPPPPTPPRYGMLQSKRRESASPRTTGHGTEDEETK